MRYVIQEHYDDTHQECTNGDCDWRGAVFDEPAPTCPRCWNRLEVVGPGA